MSAKVFKKDVAGAFNSFRIPGVGGGVTQTAELQSFVFPGSADYAPKTPAVNHAGGHASDHSIEAVLQAAHADAAQIIADAERQKTIWQQEARESGLNEARQMIESEVTAKVMSEISLLRENLAAAIGQVSALAPEIVGQAETELLELALDIAKKVVGREVSIDREVALTLVKISLAKLHNRTYAKIHLNPIDFSFIDAHRERLNFQGSLEIVEDRSISPGGCLVHTQTGDIDARIESQFDEIAHGLLGK